MMINRGSLLIVYLIFMPLMLIFGDKRTIAKELNLTSVENSMENKTELQKIQHDINDQYPISLKVDDCMLVTGKNMSTPEIMAVQSLQKRIFRLTQKKIPMKSVSELNEKDKTTYNLILVGTYSNNSIANAIAIQYKLIILNSNIKPEIYQQAYTIDCLPDLFYKGKNVVFASGPCPLGAVYAMSDLSIRLGIKNGVLFLYLEKAQRNEIPAFAERAIYLNIGYRIPKITVQNWSREDWEQYIDNLILARVSCIYFYLWADSLSYFPKSPSVFTEKNKVLHERLREMIDYAHKRGLKVGYLFTPTLIPKDIFQENPLIKADIVYEKHGFPVVCQNVKLPVVFGKYHWPNVMSLMEDLHGNEIEWFKNADYFQICFYDVGGCLCSICKPHQADALMDQVVNFEKIIKTKNPNAKIQVNLWASWGLEKENNFKFRDEFFSKLKGHFGDHISEVSVWDGFDTDTFDMITSLNLPVRRIGFCPWTNWENRYIFLIPMLHTLQEMVTEQNGKKDGLSFMRLEAGTKPANDFFALQWSWNPNYSQVEVVLQYALGWTSSLESASYLTEAILELDKFTDNSPSDGSGERIYKLISQAFQHMPASRQTDTKWFLTSAMCMPILEKGAKYVLQPKSEKEMAMLSDQFYQTLASDSYFNGFNNQDDKEKLFHQYCSWLATGWKSHRF